MSKYTTTVRVICESLAGNNEITASNFDNTLSEVTEKIFDFNFPIFDESYRKVLEIKILKHYFMREIGLETVGLWKIMLNAKLNEIMPYYNQLYKSELYEFNPFYSVDMETVRTSNISGSKKDDGMISLSGSDTGKNISTQDFSKESNGTQEVNETGWQYVNDTPQGGVTGVDSLKYLSKVGKNTSENTNTNSASENANNTVKTDDEKTTERNTETTNESTTNTTEEYVEKIKGKNGESYSKTLKEFRDTFLNIDMMVLSELEDLFIKLY